MGTTQGYCMFSKQILEAAINTTVIVLLLISYSTPLYGHSFPAKTQGDTWCHQEDFLIRTDGKKELRESTAAKKTISELPTNSSSVMIWGWVFFQSLYSIAITNFDLIG